MATLNYHSPESTPVKQHSGFGVAAAVCGTLFLLQISLMLILAWAGSLPEWLRGMPAVGVALTLFFAAILFGAIGVLLPDRKRWLPAVVLIMFLTPLLLLLIAMVWMSGP